MEDSKFMSNKNCILLGFLIYPLLTALVSFRFGSNFLSSILIFLLMPSILLSVLNRGLIKKSAIFAVLSIPFTFMADYIANLKVLYQSK